MRLTRIMKAGMVAAMAAVMVFSLGATAWGTTGLDGPTPPRTGDPVPAAAQNEKQLISTNATGGTFTLSYTDSGGTCTTASLAYTASAAQVDAAVIDGVLASAACTTVFADADIVASGGPLPGTAITLEFQGAFANTNVNQWSASGSSLGTSKYIYVSTIQNGRWAGGNDGAVAPASDGIDPHGGYSAATNYCLQCHAVHSYDPGTGPVVGPGEYALLARDSVTDTCNTCHKVFGAYGAGGRINSNAITGASLQIGTTSVRSAYDVAAGTGSAHTLGTDSTPLPDGVRMQEIGWGYGSFNALNWYLDNAAAASGTSHPTDNVGVPADEGSPGGLYCGSCHTPHGEFGQVINASQYRSNAGADALSAVQYVFVEGLVAGDSWHLVYNGTATSPDFAWDATTAAVDTALEVITGVGTITVSGGPLSATDTVGDYKITFGGSLASTTQPQLEGVVVSGAGTVEVVTNQGGSAAVAEDTAGNSANGTLVAARTFGDDKPIFQYNKFNRPQVYYLNAVGDTTSNSNSNAGLAWAWERCTTTDGATTVPSAGTPANCEFLTIADAEGQIVYEYGYKLLTAYPNHNWLKAESWGLAYRGTDSARWCGACHTTKTGGEFGVEGEYAVAGVTYHSHPTACTYCHGNPTDGGSFDFPHTSTKGKLLKEFPDALCISCHRSGTLP